MTLPKFIKRGSPMQQEQKTPKGSAPRSASHVDLLKQMHLVKHEVDGKTNPQSRRPIADGSQVHEDEEVGECSGNCKCGK